MSGSGSCAAPGARPLWPLVLGGLAVRLALLAFGLWMDAHSPQLRYTDVDYDVFVAAAAAVARGESPYAAVPTYRYTPLLAWLLRPGVGLGCSAVFGKLLFVAADLLAGLLLAAVAAARTGADDGQDDIDASSNNTRTSTTSSRRSPRSTGSKGGSLAAQRRGAAPATSHPGSAAGAASAWEAAALWLLNPLVAVFSTRGSAEAVLVCAVLAALWCLEGGRQRRRPGWAGLALGLAIQLKLYPVIYLLPALLRAALPGGWPDTVGPARAPGAAALERARRALATADVGAAARVLAGAACAVLAALACVWLLYGAEGLDQAYLYHLRRHDVRHNFSLYFYPQYLALTGSTALRSALALAALAPQLVLVAACGLAWFADPSICWFTQTLLFVTFNKVVTSQYFVWYLSLAPLVWRRVAGGRSQWRAVLWWAATQALWLGAAAQLEFGGEPLAFPAVWAASLLFFAANCAVVLGIE